MAMKTLSVSNFQFGELTVSLSGLKALSTPSFVTHEHGTRRSFSSGTLKLSPKIFLSAMITGKDENGSNNALPVSSNARHEKQLLPISIVTLKTVPLGAFALIRRLMTLKTQ